MRPYTYYLVVLTNQSEFSLFINLQGRESVRHKFAPCFCLLLKRELRRKSAVGISYLNYISYIKLLAALLG